MNQSLISSVEAQCELTAIPAKNLDLAEQDDNQFDQSKSEIKPQYFVRIDNFFLSITEKSKWIGELFLPSYTGFEQFPDNTRKFKFIFRVRDANGYDIELKPPERLRKRFLNTIKTISNSIDNMRKQTQFLEPITKKFHCKIKGNSNKNVIVCFENNYLNIVYDEKLPNQQIFLDQIDLSEPNVYVDGFSGFDSNIKYPTVFIYTNSQLRQTLDFGEGGLQEAQNLMELIATCCFRYNTDSHHSLIKDGLETQNNNTQNSSNQIMSETSLNKKSDFIGVNEFHEEPKRTKYPQGMKQANKKSLKNKILFGNSHIEQSKKNLKDLRSTQKSLQTQIELQKKLQQQKNQELMNKTSPSTTSAASLQLDQKEPEQQVEQPDKTPNIPQILPRATSFTSKNANAQASQPTRIPLKQIASQSTFHTPPAAVQQDRKDQQRSITKSKSSIQMTAPLKRENKEFLPKQKLTKPELLPQIPEITPQTSGIPPFPQNPQKYQKSQIPQSPQSPTNQVKMKERSPSIYSLLAENEDQPEEAEKKDYNEVMKMEESDLEQIRMITKSYLMLNYRKKYFGNIEIKVSNIEDTCPTLNFKKLPGYEYKENSETAAQEYKEKLSKINFDGSKKCFHSLALLMITKDNNSDSDESKSTKSDNNNSESDESKSTKSDNNTNDSDGSKSANIDNNNTSDVSNSDSNENNSDNKSKNKNDVNKESKTNDKEKNAFSKKPGNFNEQVSESSSKFSQEFNTSGESSFLPRSVGLDNTNNNNNYTQVGDNDNLDSSDNDDYDSLQTSDEEKPLTNFDSNENDSANEIKEKKAIRYIINEIMNNIKGEDKNPNDMVLIVIIKKVITEKKQDLLAEIFELANKYGVLMHIFIIIYNINCKLPRQIKNFLKDLDGTFFVDDVFLSSFISMLNGDAQDNDKED